MEQGSGIPTNPSKWKNGAVVALKSHLYSEEVTDFILYSGEPKLISPLMVIIETMPEKKSYHPTTGQLLDNKEDENYQCKCTWFSTKNLQFEETLISSKLLRVIMPAGDWIDYNYGDLVELRSSPIELGKKKSSMKFKNNSVEISVTSELSFVSPVMQVISTLKNEIKEPIRDSNTQKVKRYISKKLAKCKYYNNVSEKMTEILIPVEALAKIQVFETKILDQLKKAIQSKSHLIQEDEKATKQLVDPKTITYRSGKYYLSGYNYFNAKTEEFDLLKYKFKVLDKLELDYLPNFEGEGSKFKAKLITPVYVTALIHAHKSKLLLITYIDFNNDETKRIVGEPELFVDVEGKEADGTKKETHYLKAFCYLRNDIRHFKLNGIKTIKVLNI